MHRLNDRVIDGLIYQTYAKLTDPSMVLFAGVPSSGPTTRAHKRTLGNIQILPEILLSDNDEDEEEEEKILLSDPTKR